MNTEIRKAILQAVSVKQTNIRIELKDGSDAPILEGRTYYYTTPSGILIRFPNAYRSKFGRIVYNKSTRRIVVGSEWVKSVASNS